MSQPSSPVSPLPSSPSLEQLRKLAKELLKDFRAGNEQARQRLTAFCPAPRSLTDAQFVLAREYGFENWAALKRHVQGSEPTLLQRYRGLADDLVTACQTGDGAALERVGELFNRALSAEQLRAESAKRLGQLGIPLTASVTPADARLLVARQYDFETWDEFEASLQPPAVRPVPPAHGFTATPPFYTIDRQEKSIEPRPPLTAREWEEIFEVMQEHGLTGLHAAGHMTDAILERVAECEFITALQMEGSRRVTDAGLKHLARMPQLRALNLTHCGISDAGLPVLRSLPELRRFQLFHHSGISDRGLAHLATCEQLERVELLGSNCGDGVIAALAGKAKLHQFLSGNQVTDAGLSQFRDFPIFRTWQGREPEMSLMNFTAEPNHLLLRGPLSDKGLASLTDLHGLFALNIDSSTGGISRAGLSSLATLPRLGWLGFDASDETMPAIAELPHLRMLMCQDTSAGDAGFTALSRSRSLEYIWGRRCYNLHGAGFAALAGIPTLRGLSVSCKNVDDTALASLPRFPALVEFMPMDVLDDGFRHVGQCAKLEAVWCMYCRDTGDRATEHLAALRNLKTYYAGQTRITDKSVALLSQMHSLERVTFSACPGVSNAGVAQLTSLPNLRELTLESMPTVTRNALANFPARVKVRVEK